jgi:transcriptional regulator with XRE-family HTH domain
MKNCNHPQGSAVCRRLVRFEASELLGVPFGVVLHDAVDERLCGICGEVLGHIVPEPKDLISATAVLRACDPTKMNGAEIRFLRKSLGKQARELANDISISPEQLSRYENDKQAISSGYEKLLRAAICLGHFDFAMLLGVRPNEIFSMTIVSARSTTKPLKFDLNYSGIEQSPAFLAHADEKRDIWLAAAA